MILLLLATSYAVFTLALWLTWLRMPASEQSALPATGPRLSVVVPVRNEAPNIGLLLNDLSHQTYRNFEVIVADDASTDNTRSVVEQYTQMASYPICLLPLADEQTASPKKRAITQSIAQATGDLILTTDGDCRVGPNWLASYAAQYQHTGAKMLFGPVTFTTERTIFDSLQIVEFSSLIGSGACTLAWGRPTMCNGANLCYVKKVFTAVGGFAGVDHLASGDDEFLMHKIANQYPGGVHFLKSQAAIVQTGPHQSWRAFYQQRKRWASKWRAYGTVWPTLLAMLVFAWNLTPVLAAGGWLLGFLNGKAALVVIGLKVVPEFLFLRQVLVFLQKKTSVVFIPLTQVIYPFYVLFFGLAAQKKGYLWKGRKLS
ncbi:glycosyl transferase family 2 [Spirosoma montaniterrae]|uniref:Glycosyl transferase family 2 n=1 Tax=Spirosoma montaniterrae TaxID=1178516 RepID=A0A1P9X3Z3_9BACT|nr:glycosyl transferase family 2 [Spirosoma montaniterrae]